MKLLPSLVLGALAGDVEIGLQERNGQLEVDIIQARGLTAKPGSKTLPGVGCLPSARQGWRSGRMSGGIPESRREKIEPHCVGPLCFISSDSYRTGESGFVLGTQLSLSADLVSLPCRTELLENMDHLSCLWLYSSAC